MFMLLAFKLLALLNAEFCYKNWIYYSNASEQELYHDGFDLFPYSHNHFNELSNLLPR